MTPGLGRKVRMAADWATALAFPRELSQLGALGHRSPRE
jgi:hypothetical protein